MKNRYKTEPKTIQERFNGHIGKVASKKKWDHAFNGRYDLCGNVRVEFKNGKANLTDDYNDENTQSGEQISSALALYRMVSWFECSNDSEYCDFYKMNWSIKLKHKKTGNVLGLGEWKGGFQIFTEEYNTKTLSKEFIKDAEELLTILVHENFTINYDGTIAGSIA